MKAEELSEIQRLLDDGHFAAWEGDFIGKLLAHIDENESGQDDGIEEDG